MVHYATRFRGYERQKIAYVDTGVEERDDILGGNADLLSNSHNLFDNEAHTAVTCITLGSAVGRAVGSQLAFSAVPRVFGCG